MNRVKNLQIPSAINDESSKNFLAIRNQIDNTENPSFFLANNYMDERIFQIITCAKNESINFSTNKCEACSPSCSECQYRNIYCIECANNYFRLDQDFGKKSQGC